MTSSFQRHFAFAHPLFRREKTTSGIWWEKSVYYYWWEFLRRHEGYKETCENGGKGKYEKLYADFGNVHDVSFKQWWTQGGRGARLFAEPPLPSSIMALTPKDLEELPKDWDQKSLLIVAIPLSLRKRFIQQKLTKLVAKYNKRKRGQRTFKESRALYPIVTQFEWFSLKRMLEIYDLRKSQPNLALWKIGQHFNLGKSLKQEELKAGRGRADSTAVRKKNVSAVAASKKLASAKNIIDGVGRGKFPVFSKEK